MRLTPGDRLGPYEIVAPLGEGGMGEVYRARDTRLDRDVALKILPPDLVARADRRQRFVQEAKLASALQHPNIVAIYDIGTDREIDYVAMELIRGRTLDSAIPGTGLRLNDALRYGIQIADALAAAHDAGIVHRDLKPGNVMVTAEDRIKILDFGLATLSEAAPLSGSDRTTTRMPLVETGEGTILGTVAYMSPEQAEGKTVDARSDIFSLGAILYEMLCGRRAFHGDTAPATLAAVINTEPPPVGSMTGEIPPPVARLVGRCLRKDLARRAQHASDVKIALEELLEDSTSGALAAASPTSRRSRSWVPAAAAAAGVVALLLAAGALWRSRAPAAPARPAAFIAAPVTTMPGVEAEPTLSPDGSQVAFTWRQDTAAPTADVYVQMIGTSGQPLRLTDDGAMHVWPAWSPDGRSIAVWHRPLDSSRTVRLSLLSPLGGAERQLVERQAIDSAGFLGRIAWSPDGKWIAITGNHGIVLISVATGDEVVWSTSDPAFAGSRDPAFSPDGRQIAFTREQGDFASRLYVVTVGNDGRPAGQPTHLPYDKDQVELPVWTADGTGILLSAGDPTSNGGIVRIPADGSGPLERIAGLESATTFALSRDGSTLVFSRNGIDADVWRLDLLHPAASRAIARSTQWDGGAAYSPDGHRIAFSSNRGGSREIWVADASGEHAQVLTHFGGPVAGTARWSPDGRDIVFDSRPDGNSDIFVVPAAGGRARQLTHEPGEDARPAWSSDGKVIYFSSDRSGRREIWRMAPDGSAPAQITHNGGFAVIPAPDSRHLYYSCAGNLSKDDPRLFEIRQDGSDDTLVKPVIILPCDSFASTAQGLWFLAPPASGGFGLSLWNKRYADGVTREAATMDFGLITVVVSVSPDERYALVTRRDTRGADLWRVDHFK